MIDFLKQLAFTAEKKPYKNEFFQTRYLYTGNGEFNLHFPQFWVDSSENVDCVFDQVAEGRQRPRNFERRGWPLCV